MVSRRHGPALTAALALVSGCGGGSVGLGSSGAASSTGAGSSTDGDGGSGTDETEAGPDTDEPSSPLGDLPDGKHPHKPPQPDACTGSAYMVETCVDDTISELCEDGGAFTVVPQCPSLVTGPAELGFEAGIWRCGCYSPVYLRGVDLDDDGADELLVSCADAGTILIYPGTSDGTLSCGQAHASFGYAMWLRDVDEDGLTDLVTVSVGWYSAGFASLLRASAPGEFEPFVPLGPLGPATTWADPVELDVDGDQRPELLMVGDDPDPELAFGHGPLVVWTSVAGEITGTAAAGYPPLRRPLVADVDGDGWLDLIGAGEPSWWARGSAAGLGPAAALVGGPEGGWAQAGDVDGDGLADLVAGGNPPIVHYGDGQGGFGPATQIPAAAPDNGGGEAALIRDLDGDGRAELVLNNIDEGWNLWRSSPEGPRFDVHMAIERSLLFTTGDFDGDGRLDLVSSSILSASTNGQVTLWRARP